MTRNTGLTGLAFLVAAFALAVVVARSQEPAAPAGASQQPATAQPQGQRPIIVRTPVVIVSVTVKDSHGQLVGDLTRDDFRVLADNVDQKIVTFSSDPVPLSAVVLIENDFDQRVVSHVQKSLSAISAGFGPDDEVALVAYDELPQTVFDFSRNNDALFTTLTRFEIGSHNNTVIADPAMPTGGATAGTTPPPGVGSTAPASGTRLYLPDKFKNTVALTDAIFHAGQMLHGRGRDRRKIIFVISEESNSNNNAHGFDETLRSLLVSDVSLYSISVAHELPVGKKLIEKGASDLQKYAADTGGDTYYGGSQAELDRLYSKVTEQARNQYTLTFSPSEVAKGQDYHPIEVRVKRPGLNVDSRDGYYESAVAPGR
jgi:VWFA-related protein